MLVMVVTNFKDKGIQVAIVLQNRRVAIFYFICGRLHYVTFTRSTTPISLFFLCYKYPTYSALAQA